VKVWRISKTRHAGSIDEMLNGEGARQLGGRWNSVGAPAVYCAETSSLAALEILVHLAGEDWPPYGILDIEIPDELIVEPTGSINDMRAAGDELLKRSLAIAVPSAVNGLERTVVINPKHPDFDRIKVGKIRPFVLDERLR
jgi:RES domain-containing protein